MKTYWNSNVWGVGEEFAAELYATGKPFHSAKFAFGYFNFTNDKGALSTWKIIEAVTIATGATYAGWQFYQKQ